MINECRGQVLAGISALTGWIGLLIFEAEQCGSVMQITFPAWEFTYVSAAARPKNMLHMKGRAAFFLMSGNQDAPRQNINISL